MKPFVSVITYVNIVIAYIFRMLGHNNPRRIVPTHVLWICVMDFLFSSLGFGTTVVAIRDASRDEIVIASDALVRRRYTPDQTICKIKIIAKDCAFTMGGMYTQQRPPFDLFSFAEHACRSSGNLRQRADSFLVAVFPQISE